MAMNGHKDGPDDHQDGHNDGKEGHQSGHDGCAGHQANQDCNRETHDGHQNDQEDNEDGQDRMDGIILGFCWQSGASRWSSGKHDQNWIQNDCQQSQLLGITDSNRISIRKSQSIGNFTIVNLNSQILKSIKNNLSATTNQLGRDTITQMSQYHVCVILCNKGVKQSITSP